MHWNCCSLSFCLFYSFCSCRLKKLTLLRTRVLKHKVQRSSISKTNNYLFLSFCLSTSLSFCLSFYDFLFPSFYLFLSRQHCWTLLNDSHRTLKLLLQRFEKADVDSDIGERPERLEVDVRGRFGFGHRKVFKCRVHQVVFPSQGFLLVDVLARLAVLVASQNVKLKRK